MSVTPLWRKTGRFYEPRPLADWRISHAQVPVVNRVNENVLRVYFGTRDARNRTLTTYIDVDADDPRKILYEHDAPVLDLGALGAFDDSGVMPSCIVNHGGRKYLYYVGWNTGLTVPYRNSVGLAVSDDDGRTFTRRFPGPIVDRWRTEPHFCGTSYVIVDGDRWRMWYLSTIRWEVFDGRPEPVYHIKYTESDDGLDWRRPGVVAIELKSPHEGGLSCPSVRKTPDGWEMWYSYRGIRDYRTNPAHSYRIGLATSHDGLSWTRRDDEVGIDVSESGWDSEMIAYPRVYEHRGKLHMMYNGNGFGASGIGHAVKDQG